MRVTGSVLALPFSDIDTDQIIPATHLTTVDRHGLGRHLFDGHVELTRRLEAAPGAAIVVTLDNFGSGSSREHAVWALMQRGFGAVIARSFSRIFLENAYNNGLVPIALPERDVQVCLEASSLDIDVTNQVITLAGGTQMRFALDPLRKLFLLDGGYLRFLHAKVPQIREWARCRA